MQSLVQLKSEIAQKKQSLKNPSMTNVINEGNKLKMKSNSFKSTSPLAKSKYFNAKNENRVLGVGYHPLGQSEEERQLELSELNSIRTKTELMQKSKDQRLLRRQSERIQKLQKIKDSQNKQI